MSSKIPAGLSAKTMRLRMEDKATLKRIGSLYVGTGYTIEGEQTTELEPGTKGYPLVVKAGAADVGIGYEPLTATGIASGAVTTDKIASGAVTTDKIASGTITSTKFASNAKAPQATYSEVSGRADTSIFVENLSAEVSTSTANGDTVTIKSGTQGSASFNIKNAVYAKGAGYISLSTNQWKVFHRTTLMKDSEIALSLYSFYNVYAKVYLTGEAVYVMFSPFYMLARSGESTNQNLFARGVYIGNNGFATLLILEIDTENAATKGTFVPSLKKANSSNSAWEEIESYEIYFYKIAE